MKALDDDLVTAESVSSVESTLVGCAKACRYAVDCMQRLVALFIVVRCSYCYPLSSGAVWCIW